MVASRLGDQLSCRPALALGDRAPLAVSPGHTERRALGLRSQQTLPLADDLTPSH